MSQVETGKTLLEAKALSRHFIVKGDGGFFSKRKSIAAVEGADLALRAGKILAIVGESGSGKSVLARLLSRIVSPTSGELVLNGETVDLKTQRDLAYASQVQLVLQDPFAAMNPVRRVGHSLERPLLIHGVPEDEISARAHEILESVSLTPPQQFLDRYPHELSGGQLQRINIARALAVKPKVLLADEPISMLDVSVRLGILNLLRSLCDDKNLAIMYITHDIASARYIADEVVVMYAGQIVERSNDTSLINSPQHPYTQLLIASVPDPTKLGAEVERAPSGGSAAFNLNGCRFSPRCSKALDMCATNEPPMVEVAPGQHAKCWLHASEAQRASVTISSKSKNETESKNV
jgi:peptide/nickel transport system ATP-binding protein